MKLTIIILVYLGLPTKLYKIQITEVVNINLLKTILGILEKNHSGINMSQEITLN